MEEKKSVSKSAVWLALAGIYIGWGMGYLANHYMLEGFPALIMNGLRYLIAGIILYAFLRFRGASAPSASMWKSSFFTGFIMISCGSGINVWAQAVVPSGISALLVGSTPLWMVIIEIIIRKKIKTPGPGVFAVLGVFMGFAGIVLLIGPGNIMGAHIDLDPIGTAALLIGSFFWSAGSLKSRTANLPASRVLGSAMLMIAGGLILVIAGILMGETAQLSFDRVTLSSVLGFAYNIIGCSILSFVLYTWLLTAAPISLVSTYAYVNPVVALVVGAIVLDEIISPRLVIASALILVAVAVVTAANSIKPKPRSSAQSRLDSE